MNQYLSTPQVTCYAQIELRHATVRLKDGLSGTAVVNDVSGGAMGATTLTIGTVALNTDDPDLVPVGAKFTISTETGTPVHTVTARTPASMSPTTDITFTPELASAVADTDPLTFQSQELVIKIGEGNLTYTENREYEYVLDRGDLDTVREGDQVPLDINLDFIYEFIRTGTGESITPVDALKGVGGAAEWVSSSSDLCEPFAVDLEIEHVPPCGGAEKEITLFPDFRTDTINPDLGGGTISVVGRSNAVEPTITRVAQS